VNSSEENLGFGCGIHKNPLAVFIVRFAPGPFLCESNLGVNSSEENLGLVAGITRTRRRF